MRNLITTCLILLALPVALMAQENKTYTVKVSSVPTDIASFEKFRNENAKTPEGGFITMLFALKMYKENPDEGIKAIIVAVDSKNLSAGSGPKSYKGFVLDNSATYLLGQVERYPYMFDSYFPGATPENGYTPSNPPYTFTLTSNRFSGDIESGEIKLFLKSSGADMPRPALMRKAANGFWKAHMFSSLFTGVAAPAAKAEDMNEL